MRITPDTVLVCSEDAIKTAYSAGSSFTKGSWYQVCGAPDKKKRGENHLDLLTEMDRDKYRRQRRAIGPAYSVKGLEKHEGILDTYIATYASRLRSLDGKEVDLAEWTHIYALDGLSHFVLSKSLDYTAAGNDGGHGVFGHSVWGCFTTLGLFPGFVNIMHAIPKFGMLLAMPACLVLGLELPKRFPVFKWCVPTVMARLEKMKSTSGLPLMANRFGIHVSYDKTKEVEETGEEEEEGQEKDLLASLMALHHDKEANFNPAWVLGITLTNFGAGHETLMLTIASCIYHTYRHPAILARLRRDMEEGGITITSSYTDIVNKVPLFMAVLKESMRIYPAIGFFLPRVVPPTGATICDTYLPPGTTAGVSLYAVHHDPTLFPHPERFDPDRWMPDGTEAKKHEIGHLDSVWMGFGGGSRSCPGQYLARYFAIKLLARLVLEFDAEVKGTPKLGGWFGVQMSGTDVKFKDRAFIL